MKVYNPSFTINIVAKAKKESKSKSVNVSRRCLAVVTKINGEFKAIVNYDKKDVDVTDTYSLNNEQLILPFTDESLDLHNKTYVWSKEKDSSGHYTCIIRNKITAKLSPGTKTQFDAIKENNLICGHIVRKNGTMYFDYEDLISYHYLSESHLTDVKIDDNKPLFTK